MLKPIADVTGLLNRVFCLVENPYIFTCGNSETQESDGNSENYIQGADDHTVFDKEGGQ